MVFQALSSEVILYDQDFSVIASVNVIDSEEVIFDNIDYSLEDGIENIYVKVIANQMGLNEEGQTTNDLQFALVVDKAWILDCDDDVSAVVYDGNGQTLFSYEFTIVPVTFDDYQFVSSTAWWEIAVVPIITNGFNRILAVLEFIASEWNNTDVIDWLDLTIVEVWIAYDNSFSQYVAITEVAGVWAVSGEEIESWAVFYLIYI